MHGYDEYRIRDTARFIENLTDTIAQTRPDEPVPGLDAVEGQDASGTIYCVIRPDGRPVQVGITDGWWSAVGPGGVAHAVLEAYQYAREKVAFARLVLQDHGRGAQRLTPKRPLVNLLEGDEPTQRFYNTPEEEIDAARRRLDRASEALDAALRLAERVNSPNPREVSGPRQLFTVIVRGATIESARVNEHGLGPEHAAQLADDAREALIAARPDYSLHGVR